MRTMTRFTPEQAGRLAILATLSLLLATPAVGQDVEPEATEAPVEVTSYGTVDMAVQDADLVQVLEMLSIQGQRNIIAGRRVHDVWQVNEDAEYHEAGAEGQDADAQAALASVRAVPARLKAA